MAFQIVAKVNDIQEGKIHSIELRDLTIALVKTNGTYYAFEDVCSHDGGTISEGEIQGEKVICPRHFAEFSLKTGEPLTMPATEPISVFPVRVVGDYIEVDWE